MALGFNGVSFHHPANVRLFHYENGAWMDRTVAVNPAGGYAVAQVTSLSPFALFEPINHVPDAKLGAALTTAATSAQGAKVTLNGSASIDADHDPLTYRWTGPFPEGNGVVTGVSPTVTMPAGANTVTLMVNDGEADSKPAQQIITVTDFSVAAAAAGPTTISAGGSVKFNMTASQQFGPFATRNRTRLPGSAAGRAVQLLSELRECGWGGVHADHHHHAAHGRAADARSAQEPRSALCAVDAAAGDRDVGIGSAPALTQARGCAAAPAAHRPDAAGLLRWRRRRRYAAAAAIQHTRGHLHRYGYGNWRMAACSTPRR